MATRATTATPSVVRSRRTARCPTSHPRQTGAGRTASRRSSTATETPSSINTISVEKLARLIGTNGCPALIDVQTDEDFAADPRLIPGAVQRPWAKVADWANEFRGQSAIIVCQKGKKLSQ